jgi:hypothetical protein
MKTLCTAALAATVLAVCSAAPASAAPDTTRPLFHKGYLSPGQSYYIETTVLANTDTWISVRNVSNNADLDIHVTDDLGNVIARDVSPNPNAYVRFRVNRNTRITIRVHNYSGPGANFEIDSN